MSTGAGSISPKIVAEFRDHTAFYSVSTVTLSFGKAAGFS
jgi:hypothetical protein